MEIGKETFSTALISAFWGNGDPTSDAHIDLGCLWPLGAHLFHIRRWESHLQGYLLTPAEVNCHTPPTAFASAAVGAKCPISWQYLASWAANDSGMYQNSEWGLLTYVSGVSARYMASKNTSATTVQKKRSKVLFCGCRSPRWSSHFGISIKIKHDFGP